jgi:hypothetical protein
MANPAGQSTIGTAVSNRSKLSAVRQKVGLERSANMRPQASMQPVHPSPEAPANKPGAAMKSMQQPMEERLMGLASEFIQSYRPTMERQRGAPTEIPGAGGQPPVQSAPTAPGLRAEIQPVRPPHPPARGGFRPRPGGGYVPGREVVAARPQQQPQWQGNGWGAAPQRYPGYGPVPQQYPGYGPVPQQGGYPAVQWNGGNWGPTQGRPTPPPGIEMLTQRLGRRPTRTEYQLWMSVGPGQQTGNMTWGPR